MYMGHFKVFGFQAFIAVFQLKKNDLKKKLLKINKKNEIFS